jgi:hypothetical protein
MDKSASAAGPADNPAFTASGHERRRELRERPARGSGLIDGVAYEIFDWSSSGVCARGYDGELGQGGRTRAGIFITLPEHVLAFECDLILVRVDRSRQLVAAVFAGLSREVRVAIASYFEAIEAAADEGLRAAVAAR